jgi:hypothetical protein
MVLGLTRARSVEIERRRFLQVRTEVRINRLIKSAMYKIVQGTSGIPYSIRRGRNPLFTWRLSSNTRGRTGISHSEQPCMTGYLIATRAAIILWTSFVVMPAEIAFDAIAAELERRGVKL